MGIFKGLVELAASDALISVTDAAARGIEKLSVAAEKKSEKKLNKFLEANPEHCHLFATQIRHKFKETYYIYDHQKNIRYVVKGELLSMKHHLHIYDATGKRELATVKEKLIAIRSPFTLESKPKDFVIEINGKKIGKVKTKASFSKQKFEVTFNEWVVEGDVFGKNYKVLDKEGTVIMTASQKLSYVNDMYYVDVVDPNNEFYSVLILLALDSASISKHEETKNTMKRRF